MSTRFTTSMRVSGGAFSGIRLEATHRLKAITTTPTPPIIAHHCQDSFRLGFFGVRHSPSSVVDGWLTSAPKSAVAVKSSLNRSSSSSGMPAEPTPGARQFITQAAGVDVLGRELENPIDEIARRVVLTVIVSVARIIEQGIDSPLECLLGVADVFDAVVGLLVVGVDEKNPRPGVDRRREVVRRRCRTAARQQIPDLLLFAADLCGPVGGLEGRGRLLKEIRHLAAASS